MNKQSISLKVARDIYSTQLSWTYAFLGVLLIVDIVKIIFSFINHEPTEGFFNTSFMASNFYMFIIGVIAMQFLAYYVGIGVTRKDYFIGNTLASVGIALTISVSTIVIFLIEKFILKLMNISYKAAEINDIELDGNILGDTIQMMIISPYVDPHKNIVFAAVILFVNIFIFYILGWMINATFYHYGNTYGIVVIIIAIAIKMLKDNVIRMALDLPLIGYFKSLPYMPAFVSIIVLLAIIAIILFAVHQITKRVPIKL